MTADLEGIQNSLRRMRQSEPRRLTIGTAISVRQCCRGWQGAALAGHVGCLTRLQTEGKFLGLSSPDRASAGEPRKAEAWLAAVIACRAGHVGVLRWLFQAGWPSTVDAALPFHLRDLAQSCESGLWGLLVHDPHAEHAHVGQRGPQCPVERELYRAAVLQPDVGCLEALLGAGCRSPWIPFFACAEERMAHLEVALQRGCAWRFMDICDLVAHLGSLPVLDALLHHLLSPVPPPMEVWVHELAPLFIAIAGDVAGGGHAAVLTQLFQSYPYLCNAEGDIGKRVCELVMDVAIKNGHLDCLRVLESTGWNKWLPSSWPGKTTLPCVEFLLDRAPQCLLEYGWFSAYAAAVSLEALQLVEQAGAGWDYRAPIAAAGAGCPATLQYCLEHVQEVWWDELMMVAIESNSVECMSIVYESGYRAHRHLAPERYHPVEVALTRASLECVELAVSWGGLPRELHVDMCEMARRGEGYLRAAHALGKQLHEMTAPAAAFAGQLQALQFAHGSGAVWDVRTLAAAVRGGSLECLKYAHASGCGYSVSPDNNRFVMRRNSRSWALDERTAHAPDIQVPAPSLPVLEFVCQHLDANFAGAVVKATACGLSEALLHHEEGRQDDCNDGRIPYDWQLALYVGSKMDAGELPQPLAEAIKWRRSRAAAFEDVCQRAGVLAAARTSDASAPMWDAMSRLPPEIVREIAFKAHLVLP